MIEPDPVNEDERALIGAVIRGTLVIETAAPLIRNHGHREIVAVLSRFDLSGGIPLPALVSACRAAGLPPEICGCVIEGTAIGYLASCVRKAPRRDDDLVATMGRLRVAGAR